MSDWISVKDGLPITSGDYICTRAVTNNVEVIAFCVAEEGEAARWFDAPSSYGGLGSSYHHLTLEQIERSKQFNRVIGWMPMPPPMESVK
jgi:hypothetical protein